MKYIEKILLDYANITEDIQKLNRELNDILQNKQETYNTLQAAKITGMPHGTESSDQTYNATERLIDKYGVRAQKIVDEIEALWKSRDNINKCFTVLTMEEKRVIELRYINQYKMGKVAYMMKYSKRSCELFQQKALDKLFIEYQKFAENCGKLAV